MNAIRKLDTQEHLISLAGQAARLGYPRIERLPKRVRDLDPMPLVELERRRELLKQWIFEHGEVPYAPPTPL